MGEEADQVSDLPDAGWPPDESADPLLVSRSYKRAGWREDAAYYLMLAIVERLDRLEAK